MIRYVARSVFTSSHFQYVFFSSRIPLVPNLIREAIPGS